MELPLQRCLAIWESATAASISLPLSAGVDRGIGEIAGGNGDVHPAFRVRGEGGSFPTAFSKDSSLLKPLDMGVDRRLVLVPVLSRSRADVRVGGVGVRRPEAWARCGRQLV